MKQFALPVWFYYVWPIKLYPCIIASKHYHIFNVYIQCRIKWIKTGMIEYRCGDGVVIGADINEDLPIAEALCYGRQNLYASGDIPVSV